MSKSKTLVQIPVGHICITESEFLHMHKQLIHFQMELPLRTSECCSLDGEVENLKKQLSEAEAKIKELEKERAKLDKESLDWYRKYAALRDKYEPKHNAVKPDAETKES